MPDRFSIHVAFASGYLVALLTASPLAAESAGVVAPPPAASPVAAVFDFVTVGNIPGNAQVLQDQSAGRQLSDSIRLKLRRAAKNWDVIDRLTMQELTRPLTADAPPEKIADLLQNTLAAQVGIFGQIRQEKNRTIATVVCIDLRNRTEPLWTREFSDDTERARGVIATQIVEALLGRELWQPPEYGDETEPAREQLGEPLNTNGDFEHSPAGWDCPDGVSILYQKADDAHGTVLRVRTDLRRDPWLAYRKALREGRAEASNPPEIPIDRGYSSVAALEGVHVRSEFIPARPGLRYWLLADIKPTTAKVNPKSIFFPKVFVKGYRRDASAMDGLSETALAERNMTPEQFAALSEEDRRTLIEADAAQHPQRYLRECYRWYLACRARPGEWNHFAAPVPPRGGLPEDVEFLQIQIYSYWPPGEYLWDNVLLFADPRQKEPQPEAPARTPGG